MHQDASVKMFTRIFTTLGKNWEKFVTDLKNSAEHDDPDQIFLKEFARICKKHKIEISELEKSNLLYSYPGRDDGNHVRINIYPIYDQKYNVL